MIHVMLPVQYLRAPGERRMEPHKRLALAVLQTVVDDYRGSSYRRAAGFAPRLDQRAYLEARAYLASTDRSWPFSFENLCEAVGLDPGSLRHQLTKGYPHDQTLGPAEPVREHESSTANSPVSHCPQCGGVVNAQLSSRRATTRNTPHRGDSAPPSAWIAARS